MVQVHRGGLLYGGAVRDNELWPTARRDVSSAWRSRRLLQSLLPAGMLPFSWGVAGIDQASRVLLSAACHSIPQSLPSPPHQRGLNEDDDHIHQQNSVARTCAAVWFGFSSTRATHRDSDGRGENRCVQRPAAGRRSDAPRYAAASRGSLGVTPESVV